MNGRRRLASWLSYALPYGVGALLLLALQRSGVREALNLLVYDLVTEMRPAPDGSGPPITLIGISEQDVSRLGWPVDDSLLCRAIDRLEADGVAAIGLDLYRDKGVGPRQACLRERAGRPGSHLVSIFNVASAIGPIPGTPVERQAFNDLVLDPDAVVRRDLVHVAGQDAPTVSLPMRLQELASGSDRLRRAIESGSLNGPWLETIWWAGSSGGYLSLDAAGFQQMLPYRSPGSFPSFEFSTLLAGRVPAAAIRGRIVLIGSTAPSLRDLFTVPHSRFRSGAAAMQMSGMEIHAQRILALRDLERLSHPAIVAVDPRWELLLVVINAILGVALAEAIPQLRRSAVMVAVLEALLVIALLALLLNGLWLGMVMPVSGLAVMAGAGWLRRSAVNQRQRQEFQRLLGQTTSPAVASQLWEQRESLLSDGRFEGRQLPVTVLFSDTCNFTTVSEQLKPAEVLDWLNRGMAIFVPAICNRGGMVNKFTGDGLLAVFGAPLSAGRREDAIAAVEAARAIQAGLITLNAQLRADGQPEMKLRIGLHSGDVLAGSMGSSERLEYAVIGDTVNCASRLESIDKTRQDNLCRVLTSCSTKHLVEGSGAAPTPAQPLTWEPWGSLHVKGRREPLEIWELRDSAPAAAEAIPNPEHPAG
jgi:adenylate cyclase